MLGLEDYIWTNIHYNPDNVQDEEEIEKLFVVEPGMEIEYIERLLLKEK